MLLLQLIVLVLDCLILPGRGVPEPWAPQNELSRLVSTMECYGEVVANRACRFHNLVYDKQANSFLFYFDESNAASTPSPLVDNQNFLQLGLQAAGVHRISPLLFTFTNASMVADTCVESHPSILHKEQGSKSYGHLFLDNLYPIAYNLVHFGVMDLDHQLLTLDPPLTTFIEYGRYLVTRVWAWEAQTSACAARYMLYKDIIIGQGAVVLLRPAPYPYETYDPDVFRQYRARALRLANVRDLSADQLPRLRITFNGKTDTDRRRILNLDAAAEAMRARYPDADVEVHIFPMMHAFDQLRVLSSTSVFVTNIGSAAFRVIYLPTNAQVIIVGAPLPRNEEQGLGTFPFDRHLASTFRELKHWSAFKTSLKFWVYNVTEKSEYVVPQVDRYGETGLQRDPHFTYWDCDVKLESNKLGGLMSDAVKSIQRADIPQFS